MTDTAVNYYCVIPTGLCVVMLIVVKVRAIYSPIQAGTLRALV